jgi:hypothetical protein
MCHLHACQGVRYSGVTELLMTHQQMLAWAKVLNKPLLQSPFHSQDFESLSPITFEGSSHLSVVLAAYQTKSKKGRKITYDNSQANRDFSLPGSNSGVVRAKFEHGRYGMLIFECCVTHTAFQKSVSDVIRQT